MCCPVSTAHPVPCNLYAVRCTLYAVHPAHPEVLGSRRTYRLYPVPCTLYPAHPEVLGSRSAAADVLFSVNALHGRSRAECAPHTLCRQLSPAERPPCCTNYTGSWDSSNLEVLLRATVSAGHRLFGLAYGNELVTRKGIEAKMAPRDYAREVR